MITDIKDHLSVPLIVGGGIRSAQAAFDCAAAGADIIVVGNALEKNPEVLKKMVLAVKSTCDVSKSNPVD